MGKRQRKRAAVGRRPAPSAATTYPFGEDGSITLRDELSAGTLRTLEKLDAQPAARPRTAGSGGWSCCSSAWW